MERQSAKQIGGKMTVESLEKELKEEKLNFVYILYGEENYLLEACLKKIKKLFGEVVIRNKLYRTRRRKRSKITYAGNTELLHLDILKK